MIENEHAITRASDDQVLWYHMMSLGHNGF